MIRFKHYFLLMLLSLCSIASHAYDFEVDGRYYNLLSTTDKTVLFAGYADTEQREHLEIPKVVTARGIEFSVVGIAENSKISVKTAIIPEHISQVGQYSFSKVGTLRFNSILTSLPNNFCEEGDNVVVPGNIIRFGAMSLGKVKHLSLEYAPTSFTFQYAYYSYNGSSVINKIADVDTLILSRMYSPESFPIEHVDGIVSISKLFGNNIKYLSYGGEEEYGPNVMTNRILYNLEFLQHLIIRPSVNSIENALVCGCIRLRELTIEDADTPLSMYYCEHKDYNSYTTRNNLFHDCKLNTVYVGRDLKIPDYTYKYSGGCYWKLTSPFQNSTFNQTIKKVTLRENIYVPPYLFEDCPLLEEISIPNGTTIYSSAFRNCKNLKKVTLPKKFILHSGAFSNCNNLEIPNFDSKFEDICFEGDPFPGCSKLKNGLEYLKIEADKLQLNSSFPNYENLKDVQILSSDASIGDRTFSDNKNLQRMSISGNIKNIGSYAFLNCSNLTQIECDMPTPPVCSKETFEGVNKWNATLYVPSNSISLYSESDGWKEFLFIEDIGIWDNVATDVTNFKETYATILAKNIEDIASSDIEIINNALEDYEKLSEAAKDKLTEEKTDLDSKKEKVDAILTGISSINACTSADKYYNLNGLRINNSAKGLVIKRGQKIFLK